MREPKRICEILDLLNKIWLRNPDLRFNQLIYNLQSGYSQENNHIGKVKEVTSDGFERVGFDLFNLEDDKFMEYLYKILNEALRPI